MEDPIFKKKEILLPSAIAIIVLIILPVILIIYIDSVDEPGNEDNGISDELDLSGLIWEPLDGPPGGSFTVFAQNPYIKDEIYAGVLDGLYISKDNGRNFREVGEPSLRNVSGIAFTENFIVVQADHLFSYDYSTGNTVMVHEEPFITITSDSRIYLLNVKREENSLYITVNEKDIEDAPTPFVIDENSLILERTVKLKLEEPDSFHDMYVPNLMMVEDSILISVAFKRPNSKWVYDHHDLYLIDTVKGDMKTLDPPLRDDLIPCSVAKDPQDDEHLLLGARSSIPSENVDLAAMEDLVLESFDGGSTWTNFTDDTSHRFHSVKDVDITPNGVYFARISDYILNYNNDGDIKEISMPDLSEGNRAFWLEWIEFDLDQPDVVYGHLDLEAGVTGFLLSTDGMETWELVGDGVPCSSPSNLAVHPTNSSVIATSGNIAHFPHMTRDGGSTWKRVTEKTTMGDELVFDPHDPDHMIIISEGGQIYESWDMGNTWSASAEEFNGVRVFDLEAVDHGNTSIFASLHGTGISRMKDLNMIDTYISTNEVSEKWKHLLNGPDYVYDLEPHPEDSEIMYATYSPKVFENHSSVWKFDGSAEENGGWSELLRVPDSAGATSIAVDPDDPERIYTGITGSPGRIYRTNDEGEKWDVLNEDLTFSTIHEIAVDPEMESTVYAAPWGGGLHRSTDSGRTWERMETPTTSISSIVMDGSDHIFLGDRTSPSVYESGDGGASWERIIEFDTDLFYRISDMEIHQENLYVSVFKREGGRISIYDEGPMSGSTFRMDESGPFELEGDMKRAVIDFCSDGTELFAASHINGVFKLEENSWTDISDGLPQMGFNGITKHDGIIYLAGGCDIGLKGQPRIGDPAVVNNIYISEDDGNNWSPLLEDDTFGGAVKVVIPFQENGLLAGTDTGVYLSSNGGASWDPQNTGLYYRSIGSMSVSGGKIYAGTLGGGVFKGEIGEGIRWDVSTGPYPKIHNIQITIDDNILYATAFPGGVFKSLDGGTTWNECNFALPSFEVEDPLTQGYYSLNVDPVNPDDLFLGIYGHGVYVSRDGAGTWFPMYGLYNTDPLLKDLGVRKIEFDRSEEGRVYIVSDSGVYISNDAGMTWSDENEGLDTLDILSIDTTLDGDVFIGTNGYGIYKFNRTEERWKHLGRAIGVGPWATWERRLYQYSALLFDPDIEGRIYLGQFPGGFFVSEDNGRTWECSSKGLGNDGIFSLSMHPEDHNVLFAGTYNGIWRSDDKGKSWKNSSKGMPGEQWPFCIIIDDKDTDVMYTATKNGMNKGFMDRNTFGGIVMRSTDGGASWHRIMNGLINMSEYYQIIIHPIEHDILFLSSTFGVFISQDGGDSWDPLNNGMPEKYFFIRDNVANNLVITPDMNFLYMAVTAHGVWRLDISDLLDVSDQ